MATTTVSGVFGIYPTHESLENGLRALREARFRGTDISVLRPEDLGIQDPVPVKTETPPEGAATGAGAGAVIGGTLGWLAGSGSLNIPGMGLFLAAGPILATLVGASAGGTLGGVVGGLVDLGVPQSDAHRYEARLKAGGTLLSVHTDNLYWTKRAKEILQRTGAEDISTPGTVGEV